MFPTTNLALVPLLILLFLTVADASPVSRRTGKATLGFATKISANGTRSMLERDQARAKFMQQAGNLNESNLDIGPGKRSTSFGVANYGVIYTAQVQVGSPPSEYTLLIDTGSSNTWVGAGKVYTPTSTSVDTGNTVSVSYGSGKFSGEEWTDTVTLAPGLTITEQSIGVASQATGFDGFDGILGVGPTALTQGTVSGVFTIGTVTDNLYTKGVISQEVLGIYFVPASAPDSTGELTFGDYDSSVITGPVNYVPLTNTAPASSFWGIDQSEISYGGWTILPSTAGIVDTGTTFILIASDAFNDYKVLTGATMDSATGLLTITQDQYANLQTLTFHIGGVAYDLIPDAQIWPRSLNTAIGGSSDAIYLVVHSIGTPSGSGLDFLIGYSFLERYYSVFDTINKQVGFASTAYTTVTLNYS